MEEQINKLKEVYKIVFESDHGKEVMKDLERDATIMLPQMLEGIVMKVHIWRDNAAFFYLLKTCCSMIN